MPAVVGSGATAVTFLPTPWTVHLWEKSAGGPDPHRHPATFTPALDQPGTPVQVIGWYTPAVDDPYLIGHPDRTVVSVLLLAPPGFAPAPGSLIGLPSGPAGRFEVIGTRDYNHGPFGFTPGNVVGLKLVEG